MAKEREKDKETPTKKEQDKATTPGETDNENPTTISKKVQEKKKNYKLTESKICDMEEEKQAFPNSSIQAKTKLITVVKSQKVAFIVISKQKSWMVSRVLIQQWQIQIQHCVSKYDDI